jgi:hypothetical protein
VEHTKFSGELVTFCETEQEKTVATLTMNPVGVEVPVSILIMLKLVGERTDAPADEL